MFTRLPSDDALDLEGLKITKLPLLKGSLAFSHFVLLECLFLGPVQNVFTFCRMLTSIVHFTVPER